MKQRQILTNLMVLKALEKLEILKDPRESGKALVANLNGL
jgi:hypothetical protein